MVTPPTAEEVAKELYESDCSVAYYGKGQPLPWDKLKGVDPKSYAKLIRHAEVALRSVADAWVKATREARLATLDDLYQAMGQLVADDCCDKQGQHYGIASCRELVTNRLAPLLKS